MSLPRFVTFERWYGYPQNVKHCSFFFSGEEDSDLSLTHKVSLVYNACTVTHKEMSIDMMKPQ